MKYSEMDIAALSALLKNKEVTAKELAADAFEAIKTADGTIRILASCFKTEQDDLAFSLVQDDIGARRWTLTVVDVDGEKRELTQEIRLEENRLIFEKASGSMTVFLEILPQ